MAKISNIKAAITRLGVACTEKNSNLTVNEVIDYENGHKVGKSKDKNTQVLAYDNNRQAHSDIKTFVKREFIENEDYGSIPGIKNKILFKKGALKILKYYGYRHHDELLAKNVDLENEFIGYTIRVSIIDKNGEVITEGIGSANSLEAKFSKQGFSGDRLLVGMACKRALICAVKELI